MTTSRAILEAAKNAAAWDKLLTDAQDSDTDLLADAATEGCAEAVLLLIRRGITNLSYDLSGDSYDFEDDPHGWGFNPEVLAASNGHFHVSRAILDEFKQDFNPYLLKWSVILGKAENGGIALFRRLAAHPEYFKLSTFFTTELCQLAILRNNSEAAKVLRDLDMSHFKDSMFARGRRGRRFIRQFVFEPDNAEPLRAILSLGIFSHDELETFAASLSNAPLCFFELTAHLKLQHFARKVILWKFCRERTVRRSGPRRLRSRLRCLRPMAVAAPLGPRRRRGRRVLRHSTQSRRRSISTPCSRRNGASSRR